MFLSEMVREVDSETLDIEEATEYSRKATSWGTLHSYGAINPGTAGVYAVQFEARHSYGGDIRLRIGSYYVYGIEPGANYSTYQVLVYLSTGSQTVLVQNRAETSDGTGYIKNFRMGRVELSDVDGEEPQAYSSELTMHLASRTIPAGTTQKATIIVNCFAYTSGAQTNFENVSDSLTNGVSLSIEGSQVDWTTRLQDTEGDENAWAEYYSACNLDADISVAITKDNGSTVVHILVMVCPWILNSETDFAPVTLDFPQGSTLYVMTEPLISNPTVNIKIGKERAVSFGDSTDYYSTASGTGVLQHNYTFNEVKIGKVLLLVNGKGACISSLGVDIR
jgi:hypothetical protein